MAHKIKLDLTQCIAYKTCVDICFVDVINWNNVKNIPTIKCLDFVKPV
jgi:NAD-dependent dihydropyrimidine dehydrogenase PreA subunit